MQQLTRDVLRSPFVCIEQVYTGVEGTCLGVDACDLHSLAVEINVAAVNWLKQILG